MELINILPGKNVQFRKNDIMLAVGTTSKFFYSELNETTYPNSTE